MSKAIRKTITLCFKTWVSQSPGPTLLYLAVSYWIMYIFAFQTSDGFCISPFWAYPCIPEESLMVTEIEFTCCCAEISSNESPGWDFFQCITSLFALISCYCTVICLSEFNFVSEYHSVTTRLSWLNDRVQYYIDIYKI